VKFKTPSPPRRRCPPRADEVIEGRKSMGNLDKAKKLRKNQTPQEVIVWSRLRNRGFKNLKFRRQYPIGKYIVDFICLEKKIIIELDGWQHKEEKQERYDKERSKFLEKLGFRILRFWNNDVNNNLGGVFLKIEESLN
jgi:very-short-patch-repair endonuclease